VTKTLNSPGGDQLLSRRRLMLIGAVLATAGVAVSWLYSLRAPRPDTAAKSRPKRRTAAKLAPEDLLKPGPLPDLSIGLADAPVTIVEYASMTCPACANFHSKVLPVLKEKYIDKGQVRLVFREFPLYDRAMLASMTARCAGPEKALPLISALFSKQDDWAQAKSLDELRGKLFPLGQQVGLTRQAFNACIPASSEKLSSQQQKLLGDLIAHRERGAAFGVKQTPTFFVNGQLLANATIEEFDKAIEPLIKR